MVAQHEAQIALYIAHGAGPLAADNSRRRTGWTRSEANQLRPEALATNLPPKGEAFHFCAVSCRLLRGPEAMMTCALKVYWCR